MGRRERRRCLASSAQEATPASTNEKEDLYNKDHRGGRHGLDGRGVTDCAETLGALTRKAFVLYRCLSPRSVSNAAAGGGADKLRTDVLFIALACANAIPVFVLQCHATHVGTVCSMRCLEAHKTLRARVPKASVARAQTLAIICAIHGDSISV